jgi:phosphohistidine phosphatase
MLLYLLRHGKAEAARPGDPDSNRRLTAEGKQLLRGVLARAAVAGVKPQTMIVSPYIRAQETAQIARETLGLSQTALSSNALLPDSHPESLWQDIRLHRQAEQLMLVGHNPLLSEFVTLLLAAGAHAIDLKPAGLACVDVGSAGAQPRGRLVWLLTADVSL